MIAQEVQRICSRKKHNRRAPGPSCRFFVPRRATEALEALPRQSTRQSDGSDVVLFHGYQRYRCGRAPANPRGLVVPILRNTEHMKPGFRLEGTIADFGRKAKDGKLSDWKT